MKNILKAIELLEKNELYRLADEFQNRLIKIAAFPYNLTALDELPLPARNVKWQNNENDFNEYDNVFWKELKVRLPDYHGVKTDSDEKNNMEGEIHGDDPTPGPAYVFPEGGATSPSMNPDLDYFSWDQAHDANEGTEGWKNLQPRR